MSRFAFAASNSCLQIFFITLDYFKDVWRNFFFSRRRASNLQRVTGRKRLFITYLYLIFQFFCKAKEHEESAFKKINVA